MNSRYPATGSPFSPEPNAQRAKAVSMKQVRAQGRLLAVMVIGAIFALAACNQTNSNSTDRFDGAIRLVTDRDGKAPTSGPVGACWQDATTPAVIETVTEQVLLEPEQRGEAGQIIAPAVYGSKVHQRVVEERRRVWFRAPCPIELTLNYVASVQRALKARGYLSGPVTGAFDAETLDAIRRFQAERGLDSPQLSLDAARELGIAAIDL